MKILHVIKTLHRAAGTTTFITQLSRYQVQDGFEVSLLVAKEEEVGGVECPPGVTVINYRGLSSLDSDYDVVHIHDLWSPWLVKIELHFKRKGISVVWSPHGTLTPWALRYKWFKKKMAWVLYQRYALARADLIHVTTETEVENVRLLGLKNSVVVAPLGVEISPLKPRMRCIKKTILFLSRVHPQKGLFNLIDAVAQLPSTLFEKWQLFIAGPNENGFVSKVLARAEAENARLTIKYLGPVFGEVKDALYRNADLFVLPTYSENFGSVIIEALAQELPVITTKGAPWRELESWRCGWWIDIGVEPLVKILKEAMELSDAERYAMGVRGRGLVVEKYQWPAICHKMAESYRRIINK